MRRALNALLVVALALAVTACDETADPNRPPDDELILGTFVGSGASVRVTPAGGLSLPIPGVDASAFTASFDATTATLTFDPEDDAVLSIPQTDFSIPLPNRVVVSGTYSLDAGNDRLILSRPEVQEDLVLQYDFRSETEIELIAEDADAFAQLLGLIGDDADAFAGIVSGGAIRYRK